MGVGKWQNAKTNMCISLSRNPPTDNPHSISLLSVLTVIIIIPKTYSKSEMSLGTWNNISAIMRPTFPYASSTHYMNSSSPVSTDITMYTREDYWIFDYESETIDYFARALIVGNSKPFWTWSSIFDGVSVWGMDAAGLRIGDFSWVAHSVLVCSTIAASVLCLSFLMPSLIWAWVLRLLVVFY